MAEREFNPGDRIEVLECSKPFLYPKGSKGIYLKDNKASHSGELGWVLFDPTEEVSKKSSFCLDSKHQRGWPIRLKEIKKCS